MNVLAICYDRRVLLGLAMVAVAIWLAAPQLALVALAIFILLACPLSLLLVLRMMGERFGTRADHG